MRRAEPHMDPCGRAAAGEEPYTWALDARLAAITREAMVQCWEAVEQNLLRTIGASAARNGEPFERLLPAPGDVGGAPQHAAAGGLLPPGGRACGPERQTGGEVAIELHVPYPSSMGTYPPP